MLAIIEIKWRMSSYNTGDKYEDKNTLFFYWTNCIYIQGKLNFNFQSFSYILTSDGNLVIDRIIIIIFFFTFFAFHLNTTFNFNSSYTYLVSI